MPQTFARPFEAHMGEHPWASSSSIRNGGGRTPSHHTDARRLLDPEFDEAPIGFASASDALSYLGA